MSAGPIGWLATRVPPLAGALPVSLGLGLLGWWVTVAADGTWRFLSTATLRTVAAILELSGGRVTVVPEELAVGLDGFEVEVSRHCSGMDGIGLFVLVLATWLAVRRERLRLPAGLLLLGLGGVGAFVANAFRIALLIGVGASGHVALAVGGLHSKLGWILLVALALAGIALAERSPVLRRAPRAGDADGDDRGVPPEAGTYLGPLVAAMATGLVASIWKDGALDRWYGARILAAALVLLVVRRSLPSLRPSGLVGPVLVGVGVGTAWVLGDGGSEAALASSLGDMGAAARWAWIALRVVGSVLVIPVVEELAFRGFLLPWLVSSQIESVDRREWTVPAVLLSSLAFGAIHADVALGTLAGLAFAFARLRRGRLGDAVLAHATANAAVALAVLAGGRWGLWR